jgi:hypothetical protein
MRQIGTVKHVQIQRSSLKLGERPLRVYTPAPLMKVECIALTNPGVFGSVNGDWVVDVHHALHPHSRNTNGFNGVSFNFTPHYAEIRDRFGDFLVDGCAGENILIESDSGYTLGELGTQLAFQSPNSNSLVYLDRLRVAAPCVEFSHYVNKADLASNPLSAETVKTTLQFLDDGRRGFYAGIPQAGMVSVGDLVFAVD